MYLRQIPNTKHWIWSQSTENLPLRVDATIKTDIKISNSFLIIQSSNSQSRSKLLNWMNGLPGLEMRWIWERGPANFQLSSSNGFTSFSSASITSFFRTAKFPKHRQNQSSLRVPHWNLKTLELRITCMDEGKEEEIEREGKGVHWVQVRTSSLRSWGETRSAGKWKEAVLSSHKPPVLLPPLWLIFLPTRWWSRLNKDVNSTMPTEQRLCISLQGSGTPMGLVR